MKQWLLFIIITTSIGVYAEASDKQIAACASVNDPLSRLDCFDRLTTSKGLTGGVRSTTGKIGKWQVHTEVSPIDDSTNAYAVLKSENIVGKGYRAQHTTLNLRCKEDETNAYLTWNDYLGSDSIMVLTRLDKNKAKTVRWNLSTDNQATFVSGGDISFIKSLLGHKKFLAQLTPYNESPVMAVFDIEGIEEAIKPIQKACHWVPSSDRILQENLPQVQREQERERVEAVVEQYSVMIKQRIKRYWIRPESAESGLQTTLRVRLLPGGDVKQVTVVKSSGSAVFDLSVQSAVYKATPLPTPSDLKAAELLNELQFIFKPE